MKTIIAATDFSAPAENAMLYAASMASKVQASLLLLHVYQIPVSMAEVPVLMISAEELRHAAEESLAQAKATIAASFPLLEVSTESRLGEVTEELNELCKTIKPLAVITGKHGSSGLERLFFGSTSLSIVRHANYPVIVVPDQTTSREIRNVALAIDDLKDQLPKEKIKDFIQLTGAQLHIVHVQSNKTASGELNEIVSFLGSKCITIHSDEFFNGLQNYLVEHSIDMLIILPHKHSFMERLTFRTHTEELLKKLTIPVACIMED